MKPSNRPYDPDRPSVPELAAGVVLRSDGSGDVLLLHNAREQRWCLPKGHVEPGESVPEAAMRETREESGIRSVRLERELGQVCYRFYDPRKEINVFKTTVYWLARTAERRVRLERLFDEARWVRPREARKLLPFPEERHVIGLIRPSARVLGDNTRTRASPRPRRPR